MASHAFEKELNPKLEFFQTASSGRGIRTKDNFRAGCALLEASPYLYVSKSELQGKICDACLRTTKDETKAKGLLQRCSSCKAVYYCGQSCQKSAWKHHKLECRHLKSMFPRYPGDTARLMALVLLGTYINEDFFGKLVSHGSQIGTQKGEMFAHILKILQTYFGASWQEQVTSEVIFDVFCKLHCNAFTISDEEMKPVGLGLYYLPSFLNHSCNPNCVVNFIGPHCYVQAIEDIECGAEVYVSYTELLRPSHVRRKELREQYFFECQCSRCKQDESDGSPLNGVKCTNRECLNVLGLLPDFTKDSCDVCGSHIHVSSFLEELNSKIDGFFKTTSNDTTATSQQESARKVLENCESLLTDAESVLQPTNYQVLRIVDKASDLCIELGLWSKALHYCKRSLAGYQQFYPKYHPSIGLQLFRIGKLELFLDQLDSGLQSLSEAKKVLDRCYGKMHPLSKKLHELMFKTTEEQKFLSNFQQGDRRTRLTS